MTLWEMLDRTLYYGKVLIYTRNNYGQCLKLFKGVVNDARGNTECVWDYLPAEVDQWIAGNGATLIYVKHYAYEDRLESCYYNSDKWTKQNRPYVYSIDAEKELYSWGDDE